MQDPDSKSFRFLRIQDDKFGIEKLEQFLTKLQSGSRSFRYFKRREKSVIESHETTLLLESGSEIVAYGHLENEGQRLWLGIAVADEFTGRGWGELMMRELISTARDGSFQSISLSVDADNCAAIKLYRKFGFETVETIRSGNVLLMEKKL